MNFPMHQNLLKSVGIGTGLRLNGRYKQKYAESIGTRWLLLSWRRFDDPKILSLWFFDFKISRIGPKTLQKWTHRDRLQKWTHTLNLTSLPIFYRDLWTLQGYFLRQTVHWVCHQEAIFVPIWRVCNTSIFEAGKFLMSETSFKIKAINVFLSIPHAFVCIECSTSDPCR